MKSGLKQGNAMSPILFNLELEKVMKDISVNHEMELNGKNVMLVYADDIVMLGGTEDNVVKVTEELIKYSRKMNFIINKS